MTEQLFLQSCWWALLLTAICAYLLGSVNFAIIVTRLRSHEDIRQYGSGNAGATNVLRSQGKTAALLTTLGDLGKSIAAVLLGYWLIHGAMVLAGYSDNTVPYELVGKYLAGLCCILGHLYPVYFGFRGGKGVLTALGMMLILDWRAALCCLAVFIITVLISRMVSLGSILAAACLTPATVLFSYYADGQKNQGVLWFCGVMTLLIAAILIAKHVPNIKRIIAGTENKLSFGKKE